MAPKNAKKPTSKYTFPKSFLELSEAKSKQFFVPQPEVLISNQIIVINNFFSKDLCQSLISSFEKDLGLEITPLVNSKEYAARVNDRAAVNDFEASQILWKHLKDILLQKVDYQDEDLQECQDLFKDAIGLNPQLRVYRYRKGHYFGKHYDESVVCPGDQSGTIKARTHWTLLIYLTGDDEFEGGGTIFHPVYRGAEPLNVHPAKGMALLHKHGDDCLKHEAEIIKSGVKWVLRSDVAYPCKYA